MFYNRQQFALRTALLYSGSQLGNAFGGLLAIAILEMDGLKGITGWRWLFIIEGVVTVFLAIVFGMYLPNSLATAWGLTDTEKDFLAWNFEKDQGQKDDRDEIGGWEAFVMAVTDPKTWLLMSLLYMVCSRLLCFRVDC